MEILITEEKMNKLIDFVLKDAFEGLTDSDQYSVERAIRTWFKKTSEQENLYWTGKTALNTSYFSKIEKHND